MRAWCKQRGGSPLRRVLVALPARGTAIRLIGTIRCTERLVGTSASLIITVWRCTNGLIGWRLRSCGVGGLRGGPRRGLLRITGGRSRGPRRRLLRIMGHDSRGFGHEALPDSRRQRTAGNAIHWGSIIVADPDADGQCVIKADEPGVAVILAGAGFTGGKTIERGSTASAVVQHLLHQFEQ